MQRQKPQPDVELARIDDVMQGFEQRIAGGLLYGDCQCNFNSISEDFLSRGIYLLYRGTLLFKDQ